MHDPGADLQDRFGNLLLQGRYRLLDLLGQGGMGAVFRARDERLGRDVAVKVILLALREGDSDRHRARFRREAMVAGWIRHPNVVTVHDFGTEADADGGELDFIVMELLPGADLARWMPQLSRSDVAEALDVVIQAARGLAAGHRRGIVHRDVTPRNLFLSPGADGTRFHVRVTDFGIARPVDAAEFGVITVNPGFVGSPAYASPEQLAGRLSLSPASDVFALGAVAYELLAGRRPFGDDERLRLARGEPVSMTPPGWTNPAVPLEVDRIVLRALHVEPERRWHDAASFADALDAALARMTGHAPDSARDDAGTETEGEEPIAAAPAAIPLEQEAEPESEPDRRAARPAAMQLRRAPRPRWPKVSRRAAVIGGGAALLVTSVALGVTMGSGRMRAPETTSGAMNLVDLAAAAPASLPPAFARPPRGADPRANPASPAGSSGDLAAAEPSAPDSGTATDANPTAAVERRLAAERTEPGEAPSPKSASGSREAPPSSSNATMAARTESPDQPKADAPERPAASAAERARTAFARGQTAERAHRWRDAAAAYRQAVDLAPSTQNRLHLGRALHRAGDAAEADRTLAALAREAPDDVAVHRALAEVKLARRDTTGARAALRRYAVIAPTEAERSRAMRQLRDLAPRQAAPPARTASRTTSRPTQAASSRSTQPVETEGAEPVRATGALADPPSSPPSRGPRAADRDDSDVDRYDRDDDDRGRGRSRDDDNDDDGEARREPVRAAPPSRSANVERTPTRTTPREPVRRPGIYRDTVQLPRSGGVVRRQGGLRDTMRVSQPSSNSRQPWWREIIRPRD